MSSEELQRLWMIIQEIQKSTSTMNRELGAVQANVDVLMKWFWIILGSSITATIGVIINIVMHFNSRKNNKNDSR